jgi:putative peptidoglycan lipid II flippase
MGATGPDKPSARSGGRHSRVAVAAGILLSRIVGLVRERVFGFYFGVTDEADAFRAAFRIPNLLQNLFGEGVLSASFIPVYASLIADGEREEATRVAGAVFSILALVISGSSSLAFSRRRCSSISSPLGFPVQSAT